MTINLEEAFAAAEGEFLKFERIENKRHPRADLCAFLMLDDLLPGNKDIVACAEHDEIYLDADCRKLTEVATVEIIRDLHRCGVRYDTGCESLCMFV